MLKVPGMRSTSLALVIVAGCLSSPHRATAEWATIVTDIAPGPDSSNPRVLTEYDSSLFFHASSRLWKSDGTSVGTTSVLSTTTLHITQMAVADQRLFMRANPTYTSDHQLWISDGESAWGLSDAEPNEEDSLVAFQGPYDPAPVLYFTYLDELWRADRNGARLVQDICRGSWYHDNESLTNVHSGSPSEQTLFFSAQNGSGLWRNHELWKSDGTATGTILVVDIYDGHSADPENLTNVDGTVFFTAEDGEHGREWWKSDGTTESTRLVHDIEPGDDDVFLYEVCAVGPRLFFIIQSASRQLWTCHKSSAGATRVGAEAGPPWNLTNLDGTLYFTTYGYAPEGPELWKSDGTEAGTVKVTSIPRTSSRNVTGALHSIGGTIYFQANGNEVWASDGTEAGTRKVYWFENPEAYPKDFTEAGGDVFFVADDGARGKELWKLTSSPAPPFVTASTPTAGGAVGAPALDIDVTFSIPVVGVDADDMICSGTAGLGATVEGVTQIDDSAWRFSVTGLVEGGLDVILAPNAGDIQDESGNDLYPSPTSWDYTVVDIPEPRVSTFMAVY